MRLAQKNQHLHLKYIQRTRFCSGIKVILKLEIIIYFLDYSPIKEKVQLFYRLPFSSLRYEEVRITLFLDFHFIFCIALLLSLIFTPKTTTTNIEFYT